MKWLLAWWRRRVTTRTVHVVERRWYNGVEVNPVQHPREWERVGQASAEADKLFGELQDFFRRM